MQIIASGPGCDVHNARGRQAGRKRKQRLPDFDFLDGAHRNIRGGGAHDFVRDIQTIHLHPRGAAIATDHGGCR